METVTNKNSSMTFNEAIDKFTIWGGEDYRDQTLKLYVDHLRRFSRFIDNKPVEEVSLFNDVLAYKKYAKDNGWKDTTINMAMTAIRQFWKALTTLERELGIEIPFAWSIIPLKKGVVSESHMPITADSFQKLMTFMNAKSSFVLARDISMFRLFYDCGMRASELTSLNIIDVRIADCSLTIVTRKRRDNVKHRQLFFTRETAKALAAYLDLRELYLSSDALFISMKCKRCTVRNIERGLKKYCVQAGIDPKTHRPHGFRHGWGMRAAKAKMYPPYIQQSLGHESLNSSKVYLNIQDDDLRDEYHLKMGDNRELPTTHSYDNMHTWNRKRSEIVRLLENESKAQKNGLLAS